MECRERGISVLRRGHETDSVTRSTIEQGRRIVRQRDTLIETFSLPLFNFIQPTLLVSGTNASHIAP